MWQCYQERRHACEDRSDPDTPGSVYSASEKAHEHDKDRVSNLQRKPRMCNVSVSSDSKQKCDVSGYVRLGCPSLIHVLSNQTNLSATLRAVLGRYIDHLLDSFLKTAIEMISYGTLGISHISMTHLENEIISEVTDSGNPQTQMSITSA